MQIVFVRFNENQINYSFKAINDIKKGDVVVVDTRYGLS